MKKNIAMRVAAFLFILTMISTCAFATTFAKYTTGGTASDEARVAKWGVTVTATGKNAMFSTNPEGAVKSLDTDKVVAPGTKKENATTFTITGQPEVAVSVTYRVNIELTGWELGSGEYCPVVFTVKAGTTTKEYKLGDANCATINDLEATIEAAITALNGNLDVNYNFEESTKSKDVSVSWAWAFKAGDTGAHPNQLDEKDTALGDLATAPTISIEVECTVSQLDTYPVAP